MAEDGESPRRDEPELPAVPAVVGRQATAQNALRQLGPVYLDIVAHQFDRLDALAYQAALANEWGAAIKARSTIANVAARLVGLEVGQKVSMTHTLQSQEDVPAWESWPAEVREALEDALRRSHAKTINAASSREGEGQ